ncbi:hypothetical protein BAAM0483_05455 [Bifidobacterium animalis subsp. animalis MCC 0483]|uniref:Uncharacterized protein n=1 Tax=Bifidobacterium animalis subsp. animalis MCC 0483 TaxID=1365955 RepID=A0AB34T9K9_9BIFI|nr:hypothetical protein [Bifidobacterium animalis]KOA49592.1 hypothetical protein BAAM0483_05455 [Bifidobacterium animalis subsp. animalis MCC 0483]
MDETCEYGEGLPVVHMEAVDGEPDGTMTVVLMAGRTHAGTRELQPLLTVDMDRLNSDDESTSDAPVMLGSLSYGMLVELYAHYHSVLDDLAAFLQIGVEGMHETMDELAAQVVAKQGVRDAERYANGEDHPSM